MYMELSEKLAIKRHEELRGDLKGVAKAISEMGKDDPELKGLLRENSQAINNFVKAVERMESAEKTEIKVENKNEEIAQLVTEFSKQMAVILQGINKRLETLENVKKPKALKVKRGGFQGTGLINEIIVEY